jgi:hypothetical protein
MFGEAAVWNEFGALTMVDQRRKLPTVEGLTPIASRMAWRFAGLAMPVRKTWQSIAVRASGHDYRIAGGVVVAAITVLPVTLPEQGRLKVSGL